MILGIDHALIAVDDLDAAMRTFQRLGFHVVRGGQHPNHGTHNALVPLSDGCYLELIGVWDRALASRYPHTNRIVEALNNPNRLALFALDADDLDADVQAIRKRGLAISDPVPGERERPDGERVAWRTAHRDDPRLPFLIEDETPRALRVPKADEGIGARLRIAQLIIRSDDVPETSEKFELLLGGRTHGQLFTMDRGEIGLESGSGSFTLDRLVLATDRVNELAEFWLERAVPFSDTQTQGGKRLLIPHPTAGVRLHVV